MREGLAREFPEAGRIAAAARSRGRPIVRSEPVIWAAVSGVGAGYIVSEIVQALVALSGYALGPAPGPAIATLAPLVTIGGVLAGAATAMRVGGPLALALYLAYLALGVGLRIPDTVTFCERSGGVSGFAGPDLCTPLGFAASLWPQLLGIGAGLALARVIVKRGAGINSVLRIAGSYAIATFVVVQVWAATVARTANPTTSGLTIAAATVAAAAAAGVVAAQLPRGIRGAAVVAAVSLLPWLTTHLPLSLQGGRTVPDDFAELFVGINVLRQPIAAAMMVLTAGLAARSRFVPRYMRNIES